MARVPGFEPGLAVLETAVLAVEHYTDIGSRGFYRTPYLKLQPSIMPKQLGC